MTNEQELSLDSARTHLQGALRLIETLLTDKAVEPEDADSDTSEAIDKCNSAIEYLYEAKASVDSPK